MRNNLSIKRQIKENVFKLREEGKSYKQIAKQLDCSKGTVNYHLSEGAAEKVKSRSGRKYWRKVWRFCYETKKEDNVQPYKETLLRKKGRAFLYGRKDKHTYRRNRMGLKYKDTKLFHCLNKIWPGMKKEKDVYQAVNQWTGEPDFYDDGTPIMTPYVRCKLTDEIIMARGNDIHVDHINGDRTDNNPDNWSFVKDWANAMKADAKTYDVLEERLEKVLKTIRKYK